MSSKEKSSSSKSNVGTVRRRRFQSVGRVSIHEGSLIQSQSALSEFGATVSPDIGQRISSYANVATFTSSSSAHPHTQRHSTSSSTTKTRSKSLSYSRPGHSSSSFMR